MQFTMLPVPFVYGHTFLFYGTDAHKYIDKTLRKKNNLDVIVLYSVLLMLI